MSYKLDLDIYAENHIQCGNDIKKLLNENKKLEKALDKACEELQRLHIELIKNKGHFYLDGRPQQKWWGKEQWKEYIIKESEKK